MSHRLKGYLLNCRHSLPAVPTFGLCRAEQVADPAVAERQVEECAVRYLQELWRLIEENRRTRAAGGGGMAAGHM